MLRKAYTYTNNQRRVSRYSYRRYVSIDTFVSLSVSRKTMIKYRCIGIAQYYFSKCIDKNGDNDKNHITDNIDTWML